MFSVLKHTEYRIMGEINTYILKTNELGKEGPQIHILIIDVIQIYNIV